MWPRSRPAMKSSHEVAFPMQALKSFSAAPSISSCNVGNAGCLICDTPDHTCSCACLQGHYIYHMQAFCSCGKANLMFAHVIGALTETLQLSTMQLSTMQRVQISFKILILILTWMVFSSCGTAVLISAQGTGVLAPVSRRTSTTFCPVRSRGPSSMRIGTPCITQRVKSASAS